MEENVNGCYAQKPLQSAKRIVEASSNPGDLVLDFFSHSGTTLLACELLGRDCFTVDIDPVFCEVTIRRLERYRETGKLGWQNSNPFIEEQRVDKQLQALIGAVESESKLLFS
jgi:site-specific DNA-methyltransferase (adenine-specific)